MLHVRIRGEHRGRRGGGQLGLAGEERRQVPERGADPHGRGLAAIDPRRRERTELAPEGLGDQMVLGAKVGVGGGGRDSGASRDVAHGEPLVAARPDLVHRGIGQPLNEAGLPFGEAAARWFGREH